MLFHQWSSKDGNGMGCLHLSTVMGRVLHGRTLHGTMFHVPFRTERGLRDSLAIVTYAGLFILGCAIDARLIQKKFSL